MNIVDRMLGITNSIEIVESHYNMINKEGRKKMEMKRNLRETIKAIKEMNIQEVECYANNIHHSIHALFCAKKEMEQDQFDQTKKYLFTVRDILDDYRHKGLSLDKIMEKYDLVEKETIRKKVENKMESIIEYAMRIRDEEMTREYEDLEDKNKELREKIDFLRDALYETVTKLTEENKKLKEINFRITHTNLELNRENQKLLNKIKIKDQIIKGADKKLEEISEWKNTRH